MNNNNLNDKNDNTIQNPLNQNQMFGYNFIPPQQQVGTNEQINNQNNGMFQNPSVTGATNFVQRPPETQNPQQPVGTNEQVNNQVNDMFQNPSVTEATNFIQPTPETQNPQQPVGTNEQLNKSLLSHANTMDDNKEMIQPIGINQESQNINNLNQSNLQNNMLNQNQEQKNENQSETITNSTDDEELLKIFIGKNYEKIKNKPFNFAGFFFTTFYMFYRKMFMYAIILFLINLVVLNVIDNFIITFAFNILVGLFVNKFYLYYAKKKINKIKIKNSQKDINELKSLCSSKGGTSVGKIFLGFLAELVIAFVILIIMVIAGIGSVLSDLINLDNWNITINGNKINNNAQNDNSNKNATLVEDVAVKGYSCIGLECSVSIEKENELTDYVFNANNVELFKLLGDYKDYVKIDIYYNENSIVDYKVFLKSTNEEVTNVTNEDELRTKIGLYSLGTHTDIFTLSKIGTTGVGIKDDESFTYANYVLTDSKNIEYEMKYIISDDSKNIMKNLVEENKYNITFEVVEETFGYEFYIKSIN